MKVVVAESSGFCFGVKRAVSMCEKAAVERSGCVTLGPIIHNKHVISELNEMGVRVASDISDILPGSTVIIPSHGAGKNEYEYLVEQGISVLDATCPDVKRIHDIVVGELQSGRLPVIIGERRHPEVVAISSWCGRCEVFETPEELENWLISGDNAQIYISVVFQTTNTKAVFNSCVDIIKKECTNHKIFDTICSATRKRQQEAVELSKCSDAMIVVGGVNSANSLRLVDICRENCSTVIFVENAEDLEKADICASDTVGIIAGASTPAWIIKEVTRKMSEENRIDETCPEQVPEDNPAVEIQNSESNLTQPAAAEEHETTTIPEQAEGAEAFSASQESIISETAEIVSEETDEPAMREDADAESEYESDTGAMTETFEEMLEKSIKTLHTGQKVTGVVTSITSTEVSVDLGTKQSGYIPISEFADDANSRIEDIIKIGDTIETFVMRVNDVEGMVMLSKKRLDAIKNWDVIEAAKESKAIVEGTVTEENKGGVVVNIKGVRVFVPASQTGLPKSSPMSELIKKTVKLRITEVNQSRRRVVGSIRAVQADERREKSERLWTDIENGKQYIGVVKSMTSYGVFVDIGGVDGMIHISELSWTRIKQPSEIMSVGDEVSVYVLSFDKETRKISLGYKKSEDNPWTKFTSNNAIGDVINVKIVKLMPFGAFAEINPGVDGLIHISQITDHRIGLPSEILSDGQFVDVKITEIDNERKKVSLSIRALIDPSSQSATETEAAEPAEIDNTPVIIYDTDAPPPPEPDEETEAPEQDNSGVVEAEAAKPEITEETDAAEESKDTQALEAKLEDEGAVDEEPAQDSKETE